MKKATLVICTLILTASLAVVGSALVTNNGDNTWTLSYTWPTAIYQSKADAFAAMYPEDYQNWLTNKNSTDSAANHRLYMNFKVKAYILEIEGANNYQQALKTIQPTAVVDGAN